MKLLIQKSSETKEGIASEIKNIRELLSQLENELQEEFEEEEEPDNNEFADQEEIVGEEKLVVSENDNEILIEMIVPGFQKEDFIAEVSENGILSISLRNEKESNEIDGSMNVFYHSFQLPEEADMDEIEAIYKNNTLTILIGKTTTEVFGVGPVN
jgi:HSP20 family molecular chaperone IbpA